MISTGSTNIPSPMEEATSCNEAPGGGKQFVIHSSNLMKLFPTEDDVQMGDHGLELSSMNSNLLSPASKHNEEDQMVPHSVVQETRTGTVERCPSSLHSELVPPPVTLDSYTTGESVIPKEVMVPAVETENSDGNILDKYEHVICKVDQNIPHSEAENNVEHNNNTDKQNNDSTLTRSETFQPEEHSQDPMLTTKSIQDNSPTMNQKHVNISERSSDSKLSKSSTKNRVDVELVEEDQSEMRKYYSEKDQRSKDVNQNVGLYLNRDEPNSRTNMFSINHKMKPPSHPYREVLNRNWYHSPSTSLCPTENTVSKCNRYLNVKDKSSAPEKRYFLMNSVREDEPEPGEIIRDRNASFDKLNPKMIHNYKSSSRGAVKDTGSTKKYPKQWHFPFGPNNKKQTIREIEHSANSIEAERRKQSILFPVNISNGYPQSYPIPLQTETSALLLKEKILKKQFQQSYKHNPYASLINRKRPLNNNEVREMNHSTKKPYIDESQEIARKKIDELQSSLRLNSSGAPKRQLNSVVDKLWTSKKLSNSDKTVANSESQQEPSIENQDKKPSSHSRKSNHVTKLFECSMCGYQDRRYSDIERHIIAKHQPNGCFCDRCGETLANHCQCQGKVEAGPEPPKFQCPVCRKFCKTRISLRRHKAKVHATDILSCLAAYQPPYTCAMCFEDQHSYSVYKEHMHAHGVVCPFVCATCGKSFPSKNGLALHFAKVHRM